MLLLSLLLVLHLTIQLHQTPFESEKYDGEMLNPILLVMSS